MLTLFAVADVAVFLSTPSARRATSGRRGPSQGAKFLSTPSARRATLRGHPDGSRSRNFYPRPPRGGRHFALSGGRILADISIHALREEGDGSCPAGCRLSVWISIHALREEGDLAAEGAFW